MMMWGLLSSAVGLMMMITAFVKRYFPLSSGLTALACDSTSVNSFS